MQLTNAELCVCQGQVAVTLHLLSKTERLLRVKG